MLLPAALVLIITGRLVATRLVAQVPPSPPAAPVIAADEPAAQRAIAYTQPLPPLPRCEGWPDDFDLRVAKQLCSFRVDLEINEHWEFYVRAEVVDGRAAALTFGSFDRICTYCFDENAEGREARGRQTRRELVKCVRERLTRLTFPAQPRCVFETGWWITSDW